MSSSKRIAVGAAAAGLGLSAAGLALATSAGAAANTARQPDAASAVSWQPCPQYSDTALQYLHVAPPDFAKFRAVWARTECGTVSVPLDYSRPAGRHITIALTRLKAKDQAHRLGSLAMNPGGPGGSGYHMPAQLQMENAGDVALNDRYDLIGIDPRGVGYSTNYTCPAPSRGGRSWEPSTGACCRARWPGCGWTASCHRRE